MNRQKPSDEKLRELVLLIATLSEGDAPFGKTKLNKIAFFADVTAYLNFGKSITGREYQRLPEGPAPRRLLAVMPAFRKPAEPDSDLAVRVHDYFGWTLERPLALRPPKTRKFAPEELKLIEDLVKRFWGMNAREISDKSHRFIGWLLAQHGETIPYSTALVGLREPTEEERKIGLALEENAKACLRSGV